MKKSRTALALAALVLPLAALAQAPDALHVRSWAAACANCHGTNGNAQPGMIGLAGMGQGDIVQKMQDFKSGKRPATVMHQIAKGYNDEQISAIAGYFASQKK
jgi:cytochrome subunit of sulfide dehydrogenase